jgi:hypothetical protein
MKHLIAVSLALLLGYWLWPISAGVVAAYFPLNPSSILYLTDCGRLPVSEITDHCRIVNIVMYVIYELSYLLPMSIVYSVIIIYIQYFFKFKNYYTFIIYYLVYVLLSTTYYMYPAYPEIKNSLISFITLLAVCNQGELVFVLVYLAVLLILKHSLNNHGQRNSLQIVYRDW